LQVARRAPGGPLNGRARRRARQRCRAVAPRLISAT